MESDNFLLQATCSQVHFCVFFVFLNSQQRDVVCNTPSTWLPSGRQVEDRSRASHTTKHLVCARRVRVGPFQAVKADPSFSLPRP